MKLRLSLTSLESSPLAVPWYLQLCASNVAIFRAHFLRCIFPFKIEPFRPRSECCNNIRHAVVDNTCRSVPAWYTKASQLLQRHCRERTTAKASLACVCLPKFVPWPLRRLLGPRLCSTGNRRWQNLPGRIVRRRLDRWIVPWCRDAKISVRVDCWADSPVGVRISCKLFKFGGGEGGGTLLPFLCGRVVQI